MTPSAVACSTDIYCSVISVGQGSGTNDGGADVAEPASEMLKMLAEL